VPVSPLPAGVCLYTASTMYGTTSWLHVVAHSSKGMHALSRELTPQHLPSTIPDSLVLPEQWPLHKLRCHARAASGMPRGSISVRASNVVCVFLCSEELPVDAFGRMRALSPHMAPEVTRDNFRRGSMVCDISMYRGRAAGPTPCKGLVPLPEYGLQGVELIVCVSASDSTSSGPAVWVWVALPCCAGGRAVVGHGAVRTRTLFWRTA